MASSPWNTERMRIFLPLTDQDEHALREGRRRLELEMDRPGWAVHAAARSENPAADLEDLEYDALHDAVHVAFSAQPEYPRDARAAVLAVDAPEVSVREADDAGAYGVVVRPGHVRLDALHVTEAGRAEAEASDTDPALLWFDPSESVRALEYRDRRSDGTGA